MGIWDLFFTKSPLRDELIKTAELTPPKPSSTQGSYVKPKKEGQFEKHERAVVQSCRWAAKAGERRIDVIPGQLHVEDAGNWNTDPHVVKEVCKKHGLKFRCEWNESREEYDYWIEW